eukprot:195996_1
MAHDVRHLQLYSQLINMGFDEDISLMATQNCENMNDAIEWMENKIEDKTEMKEIEKVTNDDDEYNECLLVPNNDRRIIICDSPNKSDAIIQCIGSIETQYIPDTKFNETEKTHGTGTVVHIDEQNNIYILTAAHNIIVSEKKCEKCGTKTIKSRCPIKKCAHKTKKTGNSIKPTHMYFDRRGIVKKRLGESMQRYEIETYKYRQEYDAFCTASSGYDIGILICKCKDKNGINIYKQHCSSINLINDESLGGDKYILHIYGYPGEKREEKNFRVYYYLFGMGTSKMNVTNNFEIQKNKETSKMYIVNKGIDTTGGQSGSLIYGYNGNDESTYLAYGVHTGGSHKQCENFGTFFDIQNIEWIASVLNLKETFLNKFIVCQKQKQEMDEELEDIKIQDTFEEMVIPAGNNLIIEKYNKKILQCGIVHKYDMIVIEENGELTTTPWTANGIIGALWSGSKGFGGTLMLEAQSIVIKENAKLHVNGFGYRGGKVGVQGESVKSQGTNNINANMGGGGAAKGILAGGGGGGYGTKGADGDADETKSPFKIVGVTVTTIEGIKGKGGHIYGNAKIDTLHLGSGGGGGTLVGPGGAGGGALKINAINIYIAKNASIQANGQNRNNATLGLGGAGSGGSIYITAKNIKNCGSITALGGESLIGGNGGYGRIRIDTNDVNKIGGTVVPNVGYTKKY